MWNLFRKKKIAEPILDAPKDFSFLGVDFHSHLIPGIDDGSPDIETSVSYVRELKELGYRALITTPHIHGDFYRNTTENIREGLDKLQEGVAAAGIDISIQASAEYYLDNYFLEEVLPKGLMSFGNNQVLVEVSMAGWPRNFDSIIFAIQAAGYSPILAHPERYQSETSIEFYRELKERGVALQMNLLAPLGYYGGGIKTVAMQMLDEGLYDFAASDMHHERHLATLKRLLDEHPGLASQLASYPFQNASLFPVRSF
jgi:tyrosine-protein phosphatase YwqE